MSDYDTAFFERMRDWLADERDWFGMYEDNTVECLKDAFEAAQNPPKPEEPDTWGVVEASCVHTPEKRREWMRHKDGNWYVVGTNTKNNPDDWDSLIDPVVIREGVTP